MKKFLILLAFLIPIPAFASLTFSPVSPSVSGTSVATTCGDPTHVWNVYNPSLALQQGYDPCDGSIFPSTNTFTDNVGAGTYTIVECDLSVPSAVCFSEDYSVIQTDTGYVGESTYTFTALPPPPPPDPVGGWLATQSAVFEDTMGFNMASTTQWMGSNLLMPIAGSGMLVIYELRYWIIALIVLGAIIAFAYRAFRFYKH